MKFTEKKLPNGTRLITVPMKDNPAVTVLVMVEAGSKYETAEISGISHFLEHMVFKGTPRRPKAIDITRELDSIGAHYNAFTSQEFTGYYAKVDPKHIDTALDVVSDMYTNPLFDEAEIKKEKGVIVEEIRMYQDMPHRHVANIFMSLMYGDQPAGWNIAGNEKTVMSFTRKEFLDYRSKHYVPSATVVVVAGSFDESTIESKLAEKFSQVPSSPKDAKLAVKESQSAPAVLVQYKETDQTHLILGVRSFGVSDPRIPASKVLNAVIGGGMSSRLFQKLRDEMGVGYYVRSEHDAYTDHGMFTVSTGVDTSRVQEVITAILAECKKLVDEKVPADELKKAKDYYNGSMMLGLESSDSQAEFVAFQDVLNLKLETPQAMSDKVNAVTADDVQNLARELFKNESLNLALIGRFKDDKVFKDILHF